MAHALIVCAERCTTRRAAHARKAIVIAAFLLWTFIGLIFGFLASRVVNLRGDDPRLGIAVSILGAIAGGLVYRVFSDGPPTWTSAGNYLFPALFSVGALVIWHIVRTRGAYKQPTIRRSY
jgi:uncharacterized membrane protein YeaQ/YmgE (transglycosylase-associated protein family)